MGEKLIYDNCFHMWSGVCIFSVHVGGSAVVTGHFQFSIKNCFHSACFSLPARKTNSFYDNYEKFRRRPKLISVTM